MGRELDYTGRASDRGLSFSLSLSWCHRPPPCVRALVYIRVSIFIYALSKSIGTRHSRADHTDAITLFGTLFAFYAESRISIYKRVGAKEIERHFCRISILLMWRGVCYWPRALGFELFIDFKVSDFWYTSGMQCVYLGARGIWKYVGCCVDGIA